MIRRRLAQGVPQESPLWVSSGLSLSYQFNGRYRVYTGRSITIFRKSISDRPLSSIAVVQIQ